MATNINSKERKQTFIALGIVFGIAYLIFCLWVVHVKLVRMEDARLGMMEAWNAGFDDMLKQPFAISPFPFGALKTIFAITAFAFVGGVMMVVTYRLKRHTNMDTAQGDARFMNQKDLDAYNKRFTDPLGKKESDGPYNMILSQELKMCLDNRKVDRNMNVFVIGGSGAGKSYKLVGPNLMQANTSYVITDPSGGLYQEYGTFFEYMGYKVKCFNLDHMERGNHYNPFNYIHGNKDIEILVTTLISNTTPPNKQGGDPFWEKCETALLVALIAYLYHYCDKPSQNFSSVMKLLRAADIDENDSSAKSALDNLFDEVAQKDPDSFALNQYKTFKMGAGKTLKSILISTAVRLQAFDLYDVAMLTDTDDIDLDSVGDEKTALFVIIPTGEKTFNFLAAMMYSQLFQRLYGYCENSAKFSQLVTDSDDQVWRVFRAESPDEAKRANKEALAYFERAKKGVIKQNPDYHWWEIRTDRGELVGYRGTKEEAEKALEKLRNGKVQKNFGNGNRLPIHTRLMLDEFANTGRIPEFAEKVSTIRKYEISVTIILQSLQQMKNLYEKDWETITGNCDSTIYLGGGADLVTTEWLSKLMGKQTKRVMNESYSGKGGGSQSFNTLGTELLAASQIRTMDENDCIVFVRAQVPYKGQKFLSHEHCRRKLVQKLEKESGGYFFNPQKAADLMKEKENNEEVWLANKGPNIQPDEELAELEMAMLENEEIAAAEFAENQDIVGEKIISDIRNIRETEIDEGIEETVALNAASGSVSETISEIMDMNDKIWGVQEMLYESAPPKSKSPN